MSDVNQKCAFEVHGVFPVRDRAIFFSKHFQSHNESVIKARSESYWVNISPRSRCPRSVISKPRADILPVRPSRLVNKINLFIWQTDPR